MKHSANKHSSTDRAGKTAQSERFIEAAREAECSEDEAVFDETLKRITKAKPGKLPKQPEKGEK